MTVAEELQNPILHHTNLNHALEPQEPVPLAESSSTFFARVLLVCLSHRSTHSFLTRLSHHTTHSHHAVAATP